MCHITNRFIFSYSWTYQCEKKFKKKERKKSFLLTCCLKEM